MSRPTIVRRPGLLMTAAAEPGAAPARAIRERRFERLRAVFTAEQAAFLLLGFPMVVWLCFLTPLIQVPDEASHLLRADQISNGQLISSLDASGTAGGNVDLGLLQAVDLLRVRLHPTSMAVMDAAEKAASAVKFTNMIVFGPTHNMGLYSPAFYLPQIIAWRIAKHADFNIVTAIRMARLANGLASSCLCFLALGIARRGRLLIFVTSMLPMTLSQFGSASQDALLIASSFLLIAIVSRTICDARPIGWTAYVIACCTVVALTLARPSMIFMAGLFLLPGVRLRTFIGFRSAVLRAMPGGTAFVFLLFWTSLQSNLASAGAGDVIAAMSQSPIERTIYLVESPIFAIMVGLNTLATFGQSYFFTTIGLLGWLTIDLGQTAYTIFAAALALALVIDKSSGPTSLRLSLAVFAVGIALFCSLFVVLYVIYAPIGTQVVRGVQGRYFLAFLPLAALACPAVSSARHPLANLGRFAVMAVPAINFIVVPTAIRNFYF